MAPSARVVAGKREALQLESTLLDFGVVKQLSSYRLCTRMRNASCNGIRWRVEARDPRVVSCVTPRARLAPGIAIPLTFELRAATVGDVDIVFRLFWREDERREDDSDASEIDLRVRAIIVDSETFKRRACRLRYEQKPLMNKGVRRQKALLQPSQKQSADDPPMVVEVEQLKLSDDDLEDLALLPIFDACVYDPSSRQLKLDADQLAVDIDPSLDLSALMASRETRRNQRMTNLEAGGFMTSRVLTAIRSKIRGGGQKGRPESQEVS